MTSEVPAQSDLPFLLICPPLTVPTSPYHSIPYLLAATSARGYHGGHALDANVDALNLLAGVEQVRALLARARAEITRLERKTALSRLEQSRYLCALRALSLPEQGPSEAIATFQHPEAFYDYERYRRAANLIHNWIDLLSLDGYAGQFDGLTFNFSHIVNFSSVSDLSDPELIGKLAAPFAPYLEGEFRRQLRAQPWRLVGLSVNYISQLPLAIHMTRAIRQELPSVRICLGGTEISDVIKQLRNPRDIWKLFSDADHLVVGEGETALVQLLEQIDSPPSQVRGAGIMSRSLLAGKPPVIYEDLATSQVPRYEAWDWSRYWSPEPVILYSPTRGCYWNRCTFCDYGLNTDSPTSPSRERPLDSAVADLEKIRQIGSTVYFAVDAMSPKYLRKLAAAITPLQLAWSAELRLEKTFVSGLPQELASSGCVAISFGYESGAPRILQLIDKGTHPDNVSKILRALRDANIGVQMMGFTGFPSETADEALLTYQFLKEHDDTWTLAGIGEFVLTTQSIVAKEPDRFGIERVLPTDGDDIVRSLGWVDANGATHRSSGTDDERVAKAARSIRRGGHNRPFVGGIDSSHSLLYFKRFGARLWPSDQGEDSSQPSAQNPRYQTPFGTLDSFYSANSIGAFVGRQRLRGTAPRACDVLAHLAEEPAPAPGKSTIELLAGGAYLVLDDTILAAEENPSSAYLAAKQLLLRAQGL